MGQEACGHEGVHIAGVSGKLQVGHIGHDLVALGVGLVAHNHGISAGQAGIADILELFQLHIGEHTDIDGVFHVNAAANAAGNIDLIDHIHRHVHALQQNIDGRENSALGTNEIIDIHLVDGYFPAGLALVGIGDDITAHAVGIPADAVTFPLEQALGIDDAAAEEFGNDVNNAAAADADHLLAFVTDDRKGGLHGVLFDGAGLHSAVGGAHTAGDVAALEGRACGAGAAHKEVPVAEHQFAVGAQVDEEAHFVLVPNAAGQSAGGDTKATWQAKQVTDILRMIIQQDSYITTRTIPLQW